MLKMFKEKGAPLWLNSTQQICGKNLNYIISKAGYIICMVQCKMKMQDSLFKKQKKKCHKQS